MSGELHCGDHIHLIAVSGVGMAALAGLLKSQRYRVTGSDQQSYPPMSTYLSGLGIEVLPGYLADHLRDRPKLVVIGNAVSRGNPEVEIVLNLGIPYLSFPQALGRFLIGSRESLLVVGTHGKTTTTALLAWVLEKANQAPGFFVGGIPLDFGTGLQQGRGGWVVLEGDEYDSAFFDKGPKFLHYKPQRVIFTSLEFDHADIYRDLAHLKGSFLQLMDIIPEGGSLVVCNEFDAAKDVARAARCPVVFYGSGEPSQWRAENVRAYAGKTIFEPLYRGRSEGPVEISLMGLHNVNNALAVYVLARELGIETKTIREGMANFSGVRRRQEVKGMVGGVTVIDDFAHHPTAVRETITAVRAAYPSQRLWAIFEPRSNTSRRRIFQREFAIALADAERVVIAGVYQPEKVPEGDRLSPPEIVDEINRQHRDRRARFIEKAAEIPGHVALEAKPGDIVLVMSNGGFDGVQDKILRGLEQRFGPSS
jgi:UDP-N-acetylmuramate: L-alanyl-gamma-D-glutamyl-meso-diaminopimelate ligase